METKDLSENIAALSADGGRQLLDLVNGGREAVLLSLAVDIQKQFHSPTIEFCAIVNAKSGNCSHNCSFCAQSGISKSPVAVYPFSRREDLLEAAYAAEAGGAHRFSIVTSGARLSKNEMLMACETIRLIKEETGLLPCASIGKITMDDAQMLKEAGLIRYHHNLESNRDFYPRICTTQTYQERLATIMVAKEAGLEICVGGIFGMGESVHDRINFALEIKNLNPDSVPVNLLDPRPGTPLEAQAPLTPEEAVLAIAIFRIIMPYTNLRLAGGRLKVLADGKWQAEAIKTGLNGLMIGDYLVTKGAGMSADHALIASLNLTPSVAKKNAGVYN